MCIFSCKAQKKKTFLAVLTWFLISGKIQGGGQNGDHCWWSHRPPAAPPPLKYTSSCFSTKGKSFQNTATYQNPWEAVPYTAYNRGSLNAGLTTDDKKANDYGVGFRIVIPLFMTSAKKIFGKSFEKFYSDCIVKRCGCQITARARTDARYEAYLQQESSFENSRLVSFPPNLPLGTFGMRDSYRKAIQSGRSKPIKLKFTPKKSMANGLLSINVDAFRTSNEFTSSTSVWNSSSAASVSLAELCNPAFEEDDQTDICPIDQAIPVRDSNDNISSESTNSMYKSSSKGSVHSDQAYVWFSDSKTKEKVSEPKTVANLGSALDRKRSLSEIFLRTISAKESLNRKLRWSFS